MTITMKDDSLSSVAQLKEFAKLTNSAKFKSNDKKEAYKWVEKTLTKFKYLSQKTPKRDKGIIKKYIMSMTGYSEGNVDKLIAKKKKFRKVTLTTRTQHTFPTFYTRADIVLLAEIMNVYCGQNGNALKRVLGEMNTIYGDIRFERLSNISVSHIYNLKKTNCYREKSLTYTKTNPAKVDIGERKKPDPSGIPGYIRVDSVHQGDLDKEKGVYYIHFVDEVTQWDIVVCIERMHQHCVNKSGMITYRKNMLRR